MRYGVRIVLGILVVPAYVSAQTPTDTTLTPWVEPANCTRETCALALEFSDGNAIVTRGSFAAVLGRAGWRSGFPHQRRDALRRLEVAVASNPRAVALVQSAARAYDQGQYLGVAAGLGLVGVMELPERPARDAPLSSGRSAALAAGLATVVATDLYSRNRFHDRVAEAIRVYNDGLPTAASSP